MRKLSFLFPTMLSAAVAVGLAGCTDFQSGPTGGDATAEHSSDDGHDHSDEHGHGHPTEGPHHGSLIELGNEEYHAEVVHDDQAGSVTIYLLDAAAKEPVPIAASEVTINTTHDGKGSQFILTAAEETDGKSSQFSSKEASLAEALDQEGAEAQLVVTINGKQYRGDIAHDHEHEHQE